MFTWYQKATSLDEVTGCNYCSPVCKCVDKCMGENCSKLGNLF